VNIENLLPSFRPEFAEFGFEVAKIGNLWSHKETDKSLLFPTTGRKRNEDEKIAN
jgi:hypothetical protein